MASILKVDTIQDQSGNNIINENADTITIGASGDTVTIPSGATLSSTDPLVFPAGTVSLPAITTTGDTNTGIFFPAADTIAFTEGGAEAMRIDSSGNVGIGETAPLGKLHVKTADTGATSVSSNANELVIENTGNVGITLQSDNSGTGNLYFGDVANGSIGRVSYDHSSNFMSFNTNAAERMRIDSSGRVMVGTTTADGILKLDNTGQTSETLLTTEDTGGSGAHSHITLKNTTGVVASLLTTSDNLEFRVDDATVFANISGTERMRIDSSGVVGIGTIPDGSVSNVGIELAPEGYVLLTRDSNIPLYVNRLTNDGVLVSLRQDTVEEGNISVSGGTVSYNGFTGTHWSRFQDNSTPTILRGTVLETLDEMCDWYNLEFDVVTQDEEGNDVTTTEKIPHVLTDTQSVGDVITYNHEGIDVQATIVKEGDVKHMMSKVSDNSDAKNVYGVFVAYDLDGEGYNDFYVASVGSFVVKIKANETIAKGDLLQSNGDGTAKVQADDAVRSSSFAKVLSTTVIETYEDGSYLVPCSLMC